VIETVATQATTTTLSLHRNRSTELSRTASAAGFHEQVANPSVTVDALSLNPSTNQGAAG